MTFGISYRSFRFQKKLEFSQQLLRDSAASIPEIALRLGYGSRRKFEHAFKKCFNKTPTEFRANRERKVHEQQEMPLMA